MRKGLPRRLMLLVLSLVLATSGCYGPNDVPLPRCPEDRGWVVFCDYHYRGCCGDPCVYVGQHDCRYVDPRLICIFPHGAAGNTFEGYSIRCVDGGPLYRPWPEDARMPVDGFGADALDLAETPVDAAIDAPPPPLDGAPDSRPGDGPRDAQVDGPRDGGLRDGTIDASMHDLRPPRAD